MRNSPGSACVMGTLRSRATLHPPNDSPFRRSMTEAGSIVKPAGMPVVPPASGKRTEMKPRSPSSGASVMVSAPESVNR